MLSALLFVLAAQAPATSVVIMPVEPLAGVTPDLATQITQLVATEAGNAKGYSVRSFREVQGAMSAEQMRQAAACDSVGCAAEIAGALNSDQIVIGTLGKVGRSFVLTLTRVVARNATPAARIGENFPDEDALLARLGGVVARLFGGAPAAVIVPASEERHAAAGPNKALLGAAGVVGGGALLGVFVALALGGSWGVVQLADVAMAKKPGLDHAVPYSVAAAAVGALIGSGAIGLLAVLGLVGAAALGAAGIVLR